MCYTYIEIKQKYKAEVINITQSKAECNHWGQVYYSIYSLWQSNALSVIKISLKYSHATIKHTNFANHFRKSGQIKLNLFVDW